ncbi:M16 family metallopeptidase [Thermoactinomyces mirandus]|uniref:Insulinase family protein n=1 Tax=Thermoactinomyces mirandus TaxID=2756294 RepID=A0A7W1XS73_9BACL|nr:pitrilysin family protein [Thermoactinomyces mirandus]MBA4602095.1 insulinase family protein [Thermoactinomyces mirandus]
MIVKYTLNNGVRIVAEKIPHVRSVALGIWVGTGSENETPANNGISHFIEHMMFKGTKNRTAREVAEAFDAIGGHVNAFTSKEITCYYFKVLDEHFATALDVLADMFFESIFAENEIEKEKKVVLEEIYMVEDTPDDLVHDLLSEVSIGDHALGYPVLGNAETVQSFKREDLFQYKNQFYVPSNVVIAVAGNLPDGYLELIDEAFSHHQGKTPPVNKEVPVFTPRLKVRKKDTEQTHICLGLPGLPVGHDDLYTLVLLNNVLGGNMSSRLFQEIREERGLAYSVYSYHSSHRDTGLFAVYAGTKHGQEDEVFSCIYQVFDDILNGGLSENELQKAKEQLKGSIMLGLESTNNRMSRLGRDELLLNRNFTLDEIIEQIESITLEDVNRLAQKTFSSPMSLALISPDGKIPASFRRNSIA